MTDAPRVLCAVLVHDPCAPSMKRVMGPEPPWAGAAPTLPELG
jgi:hypothetical protein